MKKFTLLVACLSGCSYSNVQSNITPSIAEEYRRNTLSDIMGHSQKHPDCVLNNLYSTIKNIEIKLVPIYWVVGSGNKTSAYIEDGKLFLNSKIKRKSADMTVTFLHEALHYEGICGDDAIKSKHYLIIIGKWWVWMVTSLLLTSWASVGN